MSLLHPLKLVEQPHGGRASLLTCVGQDGDRPVVAGRPTGDLQQRSFETQTRWRGLQPSCVVEGGHPHQRDALRDHEMSVSPDRDLDRPGDVVPAKTVRVKSRASGQGRWLRQEHRAPRTLAPRRLARVVDVHTGVQGE
jgi:hypothetical protein